MTKSMNTATATTNDSMTKTETKHAQITITLKKCLTDSSIIKAQLTKNKGYFKGNTLMTDILLGDEFFLIRYDEHPVGRSSFFKTYATNKKEIVDVSLLDYANDFYFCEFEIVETDEALNQMIGEIFNNKKLNYR
jgi:hypothetical protein